jgi:hypothetical protein
VKPKGELMARLRERRQREGWVRLELWVPKKLARKVRDYAKRIASDSGVAGVKEKGK